MGGTGPFCAWIRLNGTVYAGEWLKSKHEAGESCCRKVIKAICPQYCKPCHKRSLRKSLHTGSKDGLPGTLQEWQAKVQGEADMLEILLMKNEEWGVCPICEKTYPNGLSIHMQSKTH